MSQSDRTQFARDFTYYSLVAINSVVLIGVLSYLIWQAWPEESDVVVDQVQAPQAEITSEQGSVEIGFDNVALESGIDFVHVNGAYGERLLPETMGHGIAFFDYDLDGDQDLLVINSNPWPWREATGLDARSRLFRNDGSGVFDDVTAALGGLNLYGQGVAIGDINEDKYPDIFVAAVGENRLLLNQAGSSFIDVTDEKLIEESEPSWSSCAAFADFDGDDDLDLFVCNYVNWSREIDVAVNFQLAGIGKAYGPPTDFEGTNNQIFLNEGGRLIDVTKSRGIELNHATTDRPIGKALAVLPLDFDSDGDVDIFVANDTVRNFLFENQGDASFIEKGIEYGIAFDNAGSATGAMGIDSLFGTSEEHITVSVGNFANEMSSFFVRTRSSPLFSDDAIVSGIGAPSRKALTFAMLFADLDLDGRSELFAVNGHVEPDIARVQSTQTYEQPVQVFWGCGGSCQSNYVLANVSGDLAKPRVGRSAAYADIDGDGDLDIAVGGVGERLSLFRNDVEHDNNWLRVRPKYKAGNFDAYGAIVELAMLSGESKFVQINPSRGYYSQVEPIVTFGLGKSEKIEHLTVLWPGRTETTRIDQPDINREITVCYDDSDCE